MRFITPLLVAITLFVSTVVYADIPNYPTKHVKTLLVCGHAVDCDRTRHIFEIVSKFVKDSVNVSLDVVAAESVPHDMSGDADVRLAKWSFVTKELRAKYDVGATVVFVSPFPVSLNYIDHETESVYGIVNEIGCLGNQECISYVKMVGSDQMISRIAEHEVGHLMGAWHNGGLGIMAPSAEQVQYADAYSIDSLRQIFDYVSQLP